jgi:hypothetical protein
MSFRIYKGVTFRGPLTDRPNRRWPARGEVHSLSLATEDRCERLERVTYLGNGGFRSFREKKTRYTYALVGILLYQKRRFGRVV